VPASTTTATTHSRINPTTMALITSADGAHMDDGEHSFMALLAAVSPYADKLVYQPTFHLFMAVPD
jgi:hypothetical protein